MNPALIMTIMQGTQLVGTLAPIGIDLAVRIKKLLASDPQLSVSLHQLQEGTLVAADQTQALIDEWLSQHP